CVPGLVGGAGVVTGEMAVNLGAVGEGMVAGDAVNTAARVQATAGPGQVLTDAATQRLGGRAGGFADAGGPRLGLGAGPAGVGKSRLDWEFWKYVDGLAEDVWWHRGHCLSYGEGVAFWALAEIVRQRLGIAEEDTAQVAAAKLTDGADQFVPDPGERAYVGVRLGRLLGVPFAGDAGAPLAREELFAGWRLFFERLAAQMPVVLLVEDAQHADYGLLDFLDYLIDWVRDLPIYVLVFARPDVHQARPGFGADRNRSMLTLEIGR